MKGIRTFSKGGIHPAGKKALTSHKEIKNAMIPSVLVVPMQQHLGKPAKCLVEPGTEVREGMLIGEADGFISANVHSPIPGTVKTIKDIYLPNGMISKAVEIEFKGEFDRSGKVQEKHEWKNLSVKELISLISEFGLVGLGGATFPAHVKFGVPPGKVVETLVINGVECEPYLTADHRLMIERTADIIEGLRILNKMINPGKIAIGIEVNKPDAIELLSKAAEACELNLEVVPLKVKYPQGDEKQLLQAVTGREVPSGALPLEIGAVVSNIGTVFSVYEAVVYRKPLMERVVTVSGDCIVNPANLKARVGTPISSLIHECGGFKKEPAKIVMGGPMMGFSIFDMDTPVSKGTSGILVLSAKEVAAARQTTCLECGRCVSACPMGLNPTRLFKWIDHLEYGKSVEEGLLDCKECGSCGYSCPAHIPLVQGMKLGKNMYRKQKVS
ncbi:MAG: electron transport complex subunit RsxC [Spirochaetales bacterium]|nr:electron transport complex subunit RsxC [Spirochaetales bacterium]